MKWAVLSGFLARSSIAWVWARCLGMNRMIHKWPTPDLNYKSISKPAGPRLRSGQFGPSKPFLLRPKSGCSPVCGTVRPGPDLEAQLFGSWNKSWSRPGSAERYIWMEENYPGHSHNINQAECPQTGNRNHLDRVIFSHESCGRSHIWTSDIVTVSTVKFRESQFIYACRGTQHHYILHRMSIYIKKFLLQFQLQQHLVNFELVFKFN